MWIPLRESGECEFDLGTLSKLMTPNCSWVTACSETTLILIYTWQPCLLILHPSHSFSSFLPFFSSPSTHSLSFLLNVKGIFVWSGLISLIPVSTVIKPYHMKFSRILWFRAMCITMSNNPLSLKIGKNKIHLELYRCCDGVNVTLNSRVVFFSLLFALDL